MERVKKGERYWFVEVYAFSPFVESCTEINSIDDNNRFDCGNYFHNRKEAESMARRLRAVMKGADVIEMPSEEEMKKNSDLFLKSYAIVSEDKDNIFTFAYRKCYWWLKSKIVKWYKN